MQLEDNRPLFSLTVSEFTELFRDLQQSGQDPASHPGYDENREHHFVYGIAGLAQLLNCSLPTAQKIKNSGRLNGALTQVGRRKLIIDADKAMELIARNPIQNNTLKTVKR